MNNYHDTIFVTYDEDDDTDSGFYVGHPSFKKDYDLINVKPVEKVFVFTKEELDKEKIEFAKLHVEAALKAASEKVDVNCPKYAYGFLCNVKKDSIINSYPEINLL